MQLQCKCNAARLVSLIYTFPDMEPHIHCYCRTPVTATPSTPSTRTSRSAPRCSTSAGGGAADGRLCGSAKTVTHLKVEIFSQQSSMKHCKICVDGMMFLLQGVRFVGSHVTQHHQTWKLTMFWPRRQPTHIQCVPVRIIHLVACSST